MIDHNAFSKTMDALEYDFDHVMERYIKYFKSNLSKRKIELKDKLAVGSKLMKVVANHKSDPDIKNGLQIGKAFYEISGLEFELELEPVEEDEEDWIDELLSDAGVCHCLKLMDYIINNIQDNIVIGWKSLINLTVKDEDRKNILNEFPSKIFKLNLKTKKEELTSKMNILIESLDIIGTLNEKGYFEEKVLKKTKKNIESQIESIKSELKELKKRKNLQDDLDNLDSIRDSLTEEEYERLKYDILNKENVDKMNERRKKSKEEKLKILENAYNRKLYTLDEYEELKSKIEKE